MFRSPFIRKKSILKAKSQEFIDKFCLALECFGETITFSDKKSCRIAHTGEGPGQIKICMDRDDGFITISIGELTWDWKGGYKDAFLKGRSYQHNIYPYDIHASDPKEVAKSLHNLSAEYGRVAAEIKKISKEAIRKKDKIDKSAEDRKKKIDTTAREQIVQLSLDKN